MSAGPDRARDAAAAAPPAGPAVRGPSTPLHWLARIAALPVMIRTGTGDHATEARLLESGADDYVEKSVEAARFVARVKAVLRRTLA